jgi:hypothetical protein
MDKVEKMDYRANSEVILWAMISLLSQSPKISDSVIRMKRGTLSNHSN